MIGGVQTDYVNKLNVLVYIRFMLDYSRKKITFWGSNEITNFENMTFVLTLMGTLWRRRFIIPPKITESKFGNPIQ